ncbi:MAG: hypothetical protein KC422_13300 [Trueperaceae bacterium]|nr:hypothetical protein [Trueperaceae bacterium]
MFYLLLMMMGLSSALASTFYVGQISNSDALIFVTETENSLLIYVCGGASDWATHTSWFSGELESDNSFSIGGQDGLAISGQLEGKAAKGQVNLANGTSFSWIAYEVLPDGPEGLFRFASETEVAGFILGKNGENVGSIRLIKPAATVVLPLRLEAISDDGVLACYSFEGQEICVDIPEFQRIE